MAIDTVNEELGRLREEIGGDVVMPGDSGWDLARQAWNLAVDQRPRAVALPESAQDVVKIVNFARAHELRVAPQGTGHSAGPLGALGDTILLKTARMNGVEIDGAAGLARAGAGALWADVTGPAAEHGLAALSGSSPDVGVVGYTLGGGVGWTARRFGLSCNSVRAVELVTADGSLIRAGADHEPDLFWALRGGGGNFGVVTEIELELKPVRELYAGNLFWPMDRAAEILPRWRAWADTVPEELTSLGRLLQLPPLPDIPEHLRGRSFVLVESAFLGDEADGAELLAPLRELQPELDTLATIRPPELAGLHMDPPQPVPGAGDGMLLRELPGEALDAVLEHAGPTSGSPLLSLELRHLGGALARREAGCGALGAFDAEFALFSVGMVTGPDAKAAIEERLARIREALAPWGAEFGYMNFIERPVDPSALYDKDSYERLRGLRRRYDPDGVMHANHPIAPA